MMKNNYYDYRNNLNLKFTIKVILYYKILQSKRKRKKGKKKDKNAKKKKFSLLYIYIYIYF